MSDDKPASRKDLTRQMFEVLRVLNEQADMLIDLNRRLMIIEETWMHQEHTELVEEVKELQEEPADVG